jgi:hypothetical protein
MNSSRREEELAKRLGAVRDELAAAALSVGRTPEEITLIVVTKNFPVSDAQILFDLGERNFGENRDNEGAEKSKILPDSVTWHFQGQVQGKKIKSIAEWANVVHSIDSLEHAAKFNSYPGLKYFIQVSMEPTAQHRGGVPIDSLSDFYSHAVTLANLPVQGLMVVPPLGSDPSTVFTEVAAKGRKLGLNRFSMGMSGDFREAIAAGATHIRVGSSILGSRVTPA